MIPDECGYVFASGKEKANLVVRNVVVNIVYHMKKSCLNEEKKQLEKEKATPEKAKAKPRKITATQK